MALVRNQNQFEGLDQGIRSIGEIMAQGPKIRAQGALNRAQIGREGALTEEANQHGELYKQQGLKTAQEIQGANEIAEALKEPGAVQQDSMGNVVISGPTFQRVIGSLSRTGHGANDTASGIGKMFTTQNSTTQANANRQNKIDVARVKPIIAKEGETVLSNEPSVSGVDPESGDPTATQGIGSIVATIPRTQQPVKALPPYTTTEIKDIPNKLYGVEAGQSTNVPPTIKATNTTSRVSGPRTLDEGLAKQYLQRFGGDKDKARAAAKADGYSF